MSFQKELSTLFDRDINRVINDLELIDDEQLWEIPRGVANSSGVLAQHLVGNLNHFIGFAIGNTGYERDRETEFTNTGRPKMELIYDLQQLKEMISKVLEELGQDDLNKPYPIEIPFEATVRKFLLHLYGHLEYHAGQINYSRRILNRENVD